MINEEFDGQCCRTYPYNHKRIRIWQADKQKKRKRKAEEEKAAREAAAAAAAAHRKSQIPEPEKEKRVKSELYHQQHLQQQQHQRDRCVSGGNLGLLAPPEKQCKIETNPSGTYSSTILFLILLTHKESHREVFREFQPSYDIVHRWCQELFRPQVPCTPSLHCPITISIQNQQPV